jgi:long-chain acyl-CoA synthetase
LRDLLREAIQAPATSENPPVVVESETRWLEDYGFSVRVLRSVGEAFVRAVMRSFFRLRVVGQESLPPKPFLLCPNHVSYLDPFALAAALSHQQLQDAYWAGWTGLLFNTPLRRLFSRAAQIVPIDPDRNVAQALALGASVLARQRTLIWFAEGGLSPDGSLQTFLPGIGALWLEHPVAVVPVFISGTNVALPPGTRFPRRTQITIRFGKPIDPARLAGGPAGRAGQQHIADVIRDAVARLEPNPSEP